MPKLLLGIRAEIPHGKSDTSLGRRSSWLLNTPSREDSYGSRSDLILQLIRAHVLYSINAFLMTARIDVSCFPVISAGVPYT